MTTHPNLTKAAIVRQAQNIAEDFSLGLVDCQYSGKNKTMYVYVRGDISPFELKAGLVKIKFQTKQ